MLNQASFIIRSSHFFELQETQLDWWPVTRDTMWYMSAILVLFIILHDSEVATSESYVLIVGYVIYVITLALDRKIQALFRSTINYLNEAFTFN